MENQARRFQLCTIEPTVDITNKDSNGASGTLVLSRIEENFQIHWTPFDGSPTQHIATFQSPMGSADDDQWEPNTRLVINCTKITELVFFQNPNLAISIYRIDKTKARTFSFAESEFISMTELVEQLIINGIAVPNIPTPKEPYQLKFYPRCHRGVYPYTPPHIQLNYETNAKLPEFWDSLHKFFEALIIHLDSTETIPRDPNFPLDIAARASHSRVLDTINKFSDSLPQYQKITVDEWDSLFDSSGRLLDPDDFKNRLYHVGIDRTILNKALPLVLGVYDINSTAADRNKLEAELTKEFNRLLEQATSYTNEQIENNKKLSAAFRVIKHDVSRTDRHLEAFRNENAPGLQMITKLLKTYCVFNPPIGYLQGMNDLFVPILTSFLPYWNDEGEPIDYDGNLVDVEKYLPIVFWCFDAMLRNTDHLGLLASVTDQCKKQAEDIFNIISKVSPIAAIWIKKNGIKDLLWCYSDFVLLFKRSFDDIWSVWIQMNCSPYPSKWLTYFVAAIMIIGFDYIAALPDVVLTTLMDAFPKTLKLLDLTKIGNTAIWLSQQVPPTVNDKLPENAEVKTCDFRFFETDWTGPSCTSRNPQNVMLPSNS